MATAGDDLHYRDDNDDNDEDNSEPWACRRRKKSRLADVRTAATQTDSKLQGHVPRLSKANLFTLLSLWMERFPREEEEEEEEADRTENHADDNQPVLGSGLVVVREGRVLGLHCSGRGLHAGQAAVIRHGGGALAGCQLYFSRRPCATCLKMVINAGVSQVFFWPGDPEVSMLRPPSSSSSSSSSSSPPPLVLSPEARLDVGATGRLRAGGGVAVAVALRPLAPGVAQHVDETSWAGDFLQRVRKDEPAVDTDEMFSRQRRGHLRDFSADFLVASERHHRHMLTHLGLEHLGLEPYFSGLRHNMRELVEVLASVAAGLPPLGHGFYGPQATRAETHGAGPSESGTDGEAPAVSQEVALHCMIQAALLAYRTEDPKVGVGAVIWAMGLSDGCDGMGRLYLVGCGYNAYPAGSQYAQYPLMDTKHVDPQWRKYRYNLHAEQNALTFRSRELRAGQRNILFVTKSPCDECVPLIRAAGVTDVYTTDQDCGKDKGEISYLRFRGLRGLGKFIWQKHPLVSPSLTNGCVGKRQRQRGSHSDQGCHDDKRLCSFPADARHQADAV